MHVEEMSKRQEQGVSALGRIGFFAGLFAYGLFGFVQSRYHKA